MGEDVKFELHLSAEEFGKLIRWVSSNEKERREMSINGEYECIQKKKYQKAYAKILARYCFCVRRLYKNGLSVNDISKLFQENPMVVQNIIDTDPENPKKKRTSGRFEWPKDLPEDFFTDFEEEE